MCKVSAKKQVYLFFFCRAAAIFMQKMRDFSLKITKFSHHGGLIFGDSDFFANFASRMNSWPTAKSLWKGLLVWHE